MGATIFPVVGSAGVVAIRQFVAVAILWPIARPNLRQLGWRALWPALLGVVMVTMNLSLYAAIDRVGLGLAVTLEFLGPLAVALVASRRLIDLSCGVAAGIGVLLLTGNVPGIDIGGVLLGLLAAAAWAAYILLNQRASRRLPGIQATALASGVASLLTTPLLVVAVINLDPVAYLHVALIGLATGILSSALPYSIDLLVLKRMKRGLFGVVQSVHPVTAVLAGLIILGQELAPVQTAGVVVVCLANIVAVLAGQRTRLR